MRRGDVEGKFERIGIERGGAKVLLIRQRSFTEMSVVCTGLESDVSLTWPSKCTADQSISQDRVTSREEKFTRNGTDLSGKAQTSRQESSKFSRFRHGCSFSEFHQKGRPRFAVGSQAIGAFSVNGSRLDAMYEKGISSCVGAGY